DAAMDQVRQAAEVRLRLAGDQNLRRRRHGQVIDDERSLTVRAERAGLRVGVDEVVGPAGEVQRLPLIDVTLLPRIAEETDQAAVGVGGPFQLALALPAYCPDALEGSVDHAVADRDWGERVHAGLHGLRRPLVDARQQAGQPRIRVAPGR